VPFPLAVAAADAIDESRILVDRSTSVTDITEGIIQILHKPFRIGDALRFYRFPKARARQLAATRMVITEAAGSLAALVDSFDDPRKTREWFVATAPGLGPKQTSMFLRNSGASYDLAVLDRHVLRYMAILGMFDAGAKTIANLSEYRRHEDVLREHARQLGYAVGLLDWAIWIVMRAAAKPQMELPIE
jgi:N-glycosylase/DNA lyase